MIVAVFALIDKANKVIFFENIFLVVNISPEVVFGILFLTLSSTDVDFSGRELWWRTYTIKKALFITRRIKLVGKKEFAVVVYDQKH